jgi:hypothetical protein
MRKELRHAPILDRFKEQKAQRFCSTSTTSLDNENVGESKREDLPEDLKALVWGEGGIIRNFLNITRESSYAVT